MNRSEKTAEAVVAASRERRAERGEVFKAMSMQQAKRQMPAQAGRVGVARGEAARDSISDEASCPRPETGSTGSVLLMAALTRENLQRALKRVRANKGAAGVDGLDIDQTARHLQTTWPVIREQLLSGTYRLKSGTPGNDPETRRWRARAWHPDGDGSADPASAAASAATDSRPCFQRAQLRLPAGTACARRGTRRAVVRTIWPSGCGGR